MLILQHVLHWVVANNIDLMDLGKDHTVESIGYLALPDAIRCFTKGRRFSHFEQSVEDNSYSYMTFPSHLNQERMDEALRTLYDADHGKEYGYALGEQTSLNAFLKVNGKLRYSIQSALLTHLHQDALFDQFVRDIMDCGMKAYDEFMLKLANGQESMLNGQQARELILDIENWSIMYILRGLLWFHNDMSISFFEDRINNILMRAYCDVESLYDNTKKFLKLSYDPSIKSANDIRFRHCDLDTCNMIKGEYVKRFL